MKKIFITIILLSSQIFPLLSQNINEYFTITDIELYQIIKNENKIIQENITKDSSLFLTLINKVINDKTANLTLVDKNHRLSSDYIPPDIINLTDYKELHTRYKTMPFSKSGLKAFIEMSKDAKLEEIDLFIASTYRSYQFQSEIFTNMKNFHGEKKAATIVAYPGASQHQLGTAVDFGTITPSYANTPAGKWLKINAYKYGFTLSYPKGYEELTTYRWEPWHYRYIGKPAAIIERKYFNSIQHLFLVFWDKNHNFFIKNHIQ
ncbi:MAG: hypothetical protein B6229_07830 [Spirochaetaceae bacterium 4572_7]|nr:MAG: hypothetical protein B6229_07830 [Spirochaetaceae bacterium 4572_7]